jgi:tetratricopeptide (TPR) repeat protein
MSLALVEPTLSSLRALSSSSVLPYLFALLAVGLLPIKKRSAYGFVSLFLALLWGWLAWRAWSSSSSPAWAATAALEVLVLVSLAIGKKLEFGARGGRWASTGSALLIYALLIFPFLGRFLALDPFKRSAFGTPLPAVLFTCGILLFTLEPIAAAAFAMPLVWALVGGPEMVAGADVVELTGLRAALLAGALFLLQPSELRRGGKRLSPEVEYRFANRYRRVFSYGLWVLVLITVALFFLAPQTSLRAILVNLALLSALGIVLWLAFTAWQSFWYRAVAWWAARAVGQVWVRLAEVWRWAILLLAAAALWAILPFPKDGAGKQARGAPPPGKATIAGTSSPTAGAPQAPLQTGPVAPPARPPAAAAAPLQGTEPAVRSSSQPRRRAVQLFAAVVLLWLAYLAYRGRKRLVIGPFAGCTGDEQLDKQVAAGAGLRLQNELARISDLFKVIDEATPSHKSPIVQVTPGVQDVGAILKDASAITFGPLKIPANLLVGLVGQMVSGPRLTGALHRIDDDFILTAEISGGGLSGTWHIDAKSLGDGRFSPHAAVDELVMQLAFRVATDLVQAGSPRWRAVRAFTEGLRAYRETQRQQQRDRISQLREAERCFIRALNEDQLFTQCHFNLGVVYGQLGEDRSAQYAYRRALKEDPDNFEACYALAEALTAEGRHLEGQLREEQLRRALWFCKAAIGINPDDARAWDLEGFVQRYYEQELKRIELALPQGDPRMRSLKLTLPNGDPAWANLRSTSEIAVALAWRSLCRRELGGPSAALKRDRLTALTCTRNLAVVLARSLRFPESLQLFRQAAWLAPRDPTLRLYEGRTLFWSRPEGAAQALRGTLADGLDPGDQAMLWSVLAQANARFEAADKRRSAVRLAHNRFLDTVAGADAEDLPDIVDLSLETPPDGASREEPGR